MGGGARLYLIGWGNRLRTIYQWARNLVFTKNRNHRIITFSRSRRDLRGRLPSGRLPAILPADTRPDDEVHRPLAVPPLPTTGSQA